ncbi:aquaporin [Kineosporiaceae bacterium B12]|nr:aquaporin [Kineococcus rubinsiae]
MALTSSTPRPAAETGTGGRGTLARAAVAELVGSFVLVLAGSATAVAAGTTDPPVFGVPVVVLAFGLALAALAAALGPVSGAHLNPAVSVGLAVSGRFPWRAVPAYALAQLAGALLAALATWGAFAGRGREVVALAAAAPAPGVSAGRAFFVEALVTFVLVLVVVGVATDDRVPAAVAPLAVGAALAVAIAVAAPLTGGAVNPARAFGPAVVSGATGALWVYLTAPFAGAVLAGLVHRRVLAGGSPPVRAA